MKTRKVSKFERETELRRNIVKIYSKQYRNWEEYKKGIENKGQANIFGIVGLVYLVLMLVVLIVIF